MTRIAVIGASGLVGSYLYSNLKTRQKRGADLYVVGTQCSQAKKGLAFLDITDHEAVDLFLSEHAPHIVFFPAAITNVDECEVDPFTRKLNVGDTIYFIRRANSMGTKVVYFSSSYVFDGTNEEPYDNDEVPNPVNQYGLQKVMVETEVVRYLKNLVIRTAGVFGKETKQKNFFYSVVNGLSQGRKVYCANDQWIAPIHAAALAEVATRSVLELDSEGVIHINGDTCMTKYEFAKQITKQFDISDGYLFPITSEEMFQKAKRPRNACLVNTEIFDYGHIVSFQMSMSRMFYEYYG